MEETKQINYTEDEIDLLRLVKALWRQAWKLVLAACIGGMILFGYTDKLVDPVYQSTVMLYVNGNSTSFDSQKISFSSDDLSMFKSLVDTYIVLLKTPETMDMIIEEGDLNYNSQQLNKMISASAVEETGIFRVNVVGKNPEEILHIAAIIGDVLSERITDIIEGKDVRIVNHAYVDPSRISPSYSKNVLMGMLIGFVLAAGLIILKDFLNNTVRAEDDLTQNYDIPILAEIPSTENQKSKYQYYYSYGNSKTKNHQKKKEQ